MHFSEHLSHSPDRKAVHLIKATGKESQWVVHPSSYCTLEGPFSPLSIHPGTHGKREGGERNKKKNFTKRWSTEPTVPSFGWKCLWQRTNSIDHPMARKWSSLPTAWANITLLEEEGKKEKGKTHRERRKRMEKGDGKASQTLGREKYHKCPLVLHVTRGIQ